MAATMDTPRPPTTESVTVGIRMRPLLPKDLAEGARECLRKVPEEPQLVLGADRAFTFDHVFDSVTPQEDVFGQCMRPLVAGLLKGLNATVLAYGQTGSGKTHTMGSSASSAELATNGLSESVGLIPRALHDLFARIAAKEGCRCQARASFIEIYKEDVHDLLTVEEQLALLPIREEANGTVALTGLRQRKVGSVEEAMAVLAAGALRRQTAATAMNATSSRSHAIFTLALELVYQGKTVSPKIHFVDLAGSERAKRTGASGERLQEGIQSLTPRARPPTPPTANTPPTRTHTHTHTSSAHTSNAHLARYFCRLLIPASLLHPSLPHPFSCLLPVNKGLLALGNVINALCEKHNHVPYRDSKLTRLLQVTVAALLPHSLSGPLLSFTSFAHALLRIPLVVIRGR